MPSAHGRAQLAGAESPHRAPALQRSVAPCVTVIALRVVELGIPTCDDGAGTPAPLRWESSGIIDASAAEGRRV